MPKSKGFELYSWGCTKHLEGLSAKEAPFGGLYAGSLHEGLLRANMLSQKASRPQGSNALQGLCVSRVQDLGT